MNLLRFLKLFTVFLLLRDMVFCFNLRILNRTSFEAKLSSLNNWDSYFHGKKSEYKKNDVILNIPKNSENSFIFLDFPDENSTSNIAQLTLSLVKDSFWPQKNSFSVNVKRLENSLELNLTSKNNKVVDILRGKHGISLLLYMDSKHFSYYLVLFETKKSFGFLPGYDFID